MITQRAFGRGRSARGGSARVPLLLVLPLVAAVIGTAVTAAPASAAASPSACRQQAAPSGILGMVHARAPAGCTVPVPRSLSGTADSPPLSSGYGGGNPPLLYGGGSVVGTPSTTGENTVHALFWAPTGYSFPSGYQAGVDTFLTDVAAASGSASNVYAVATQYTDGQRTGTPHIHYLVHAGPPVGLADTYPSVGSCTPDSGKGENYTACLTNGQIRAEVEGALAANGLPTGMGDLYLVLLPPRVETCIGPSDAAAGGTCSDTASAGFCGYHSVSYLGSATTLYADIPYPTAFRYTCVGTESPNGSPALDSVLSLISHEHNETITDPTGLGWIDSVGNEDGDECAWNFGTALGGGTGAQWNQVINGDHYELQEEFSNEDYARNSAGGCALTQSLPTASLAVTTTSPLPGSPVGFDGSGSSVANVPNGIVDWNWDFGDGTATVSGPTPTHTYASAGSYPVTLTVVDTDGFAATTSRSVYVGAPVAPAFSAESPPGTVSSGTPYRYTFAATGNPPPRFSLTGAPGWLTVDGATGAVSGTPPSGSTAFTYSVAAANGVLPGATAGPFAVAVSPLPSPPATTPPVPSTPPITDGYWLVGSDGGIFSFGSAAFFGSTGTLTLQRPVTGISPTADRQGYWLVGSDGGVFAFGDAGFYGSLPGLGFTPAGSTGHPLAAPIVAVVPSTDDRGYFMVAADGGVFAFGDARFAGSCPAIGGCSGAAVAVMPDATGNGYWLVTATGDVYAFGDAPYLGAPSRRNVAVTAAVRTPDGGGYWVLFSDGQVSAFGDAGQYGDPQGALGGDHATAVFATTDGRGYWVATAAGVVYDYGDAGSDGSMAGTRLNAPVIAASGW